MKKNSVIPNHNSRSSLHGSENYSSLFFHPVVQPKLTINNPNDKYEYEADSVTDKVMRKETTSLQKISGTISFFSPSPVSITPLQRKCDNCKEDEKMQRKEIDGGEITADSNLENYVGGLQSGGQPLSNETRNFYEPGFGYDFSNVKVHTDSGAAKSAQSINALAYTSGSNIVFNTNQYSPNTDSGKRLLGHELTHVVQQHSEIIQKYSDTNSNAIQCKPKSVKSAEPTEAERKEYEEMQQEYFKQVGENMKGQILKNAGFGKDVRPSSPQDAVKLITFWGVPMSKIITEMGSIASSLQTQVLGTQTTSSIALQQTNFVNALSVKGQQAYKKAIQLVKNESFWNNYFSQNDVFIFPDLKGNNRFSGYNQTIKDPNDPTGNRKVVIVHLSSIPLENNFPEMSASTIVHELSHAVYEPSVLEKALSSFRISIADLLMEHPDIIALRKNAVNAAEVKDKQRSRLKQILYETLAYGEEEIFVHLQQLTHQPDVTIKKPGGDESLRGAQLLEREVLRYVQRLQKIGLDAKTLNGVLDQIGRRTDIFYDRRIEAIPAGSKERQIMGANKKMAQLLFELARKGEIL
ncbi:eCIS core domain-containing protein [Ferruginibacter sp.]